MADLAPAHSAAVWTPGGHNGSNPDLPWSSPVLSRPLPDRRMLPGLAGDAVRVIEGSTEADWVGIFACLMAYIGAMLGHGPHVAIGATRHPLLIWPLLLGTTGTGRKGEANAAARRIMFEVDPFFMGDNVVSGLSTGEGLIHRLRDEDPDGRDPGVEDKRLVAEEPEFASVMARSRREGSTLAHVLRDGWEGRPLQTLTKHASEKASHPHLAVIGHITPRELRMRLAETDLAGGTYNRFLPLSVDRSRKLPIPPRVDSPAINKVGSRLRAAVERARATSHEIRMDKPASSLWVELYDEFTACDDDESRADEFTRRAAPYCRRIAALNTVIDGRHVTSVDDLIAAAALVRYSVETARFVLGGLSANPRLDRIRRALTEAGPRGRSRTEISGLFSRKLPSAQLSELLHLVVEDPCFEKVEVRTDGRTAHLYRRVQ